MHFHRYTTNPIHLRATVESLAILPPNQDRGRPAWTRGGMGGKVVMIGNYLAHHDLKEDDKHYEDKNGSPHSHLPRSCSEGLDWPPAQEALERNPELI